MILPNSASSGMGGCASDVEDGRGGCSGCGRTFVGNVDGVRGRRIAIHPSCMKNIQSPVLASIPRQKALKQPANAGFPCNYADRKCL